MKTIPYLTLCLVLLVSCKDPKKDTLAELTALLKGIETEMETYQATLTSINTTHSAMLNKHMEGVRSGETNQAIAEMITPHKRVVVNYEEALKTYHNLIPKLEEIISRGKEEATSAAQLQSSLEQVIGEKDSILFQLEALKEEHEKYREQFEQIES